jgi:hypothetical protein
MTRKKRDKREKKGTIYGIGFAREIMYKVCNIEE